MLTMERLVMSPRCCEVCGADGAIALRFDVPGLDYFEKHPICSEACAKQFNEKMVEEWFCRAVPIAYQRTIHEKLPDQEAFRLVMDHDHTDWPSESYKKGLFLYGATGGGKTRSLCAKIRNIYASGEEVLFTRGNMISTGIVQRTRPGGDGGFDEWFTRFKSADVLAVDEFDKVSFTPRVRAEVFDLIEHRVSNELPIYYTAQCQVSQLSQKFGKDGREEYLGIIRRIVENSVPIHFKP